MLIAVVTFAWRAEHEVAAVQAAPVPAAAPAARAGGAAFSTFASRYVSPERLEVWGGVDAPDGATVALDLRAVGHPTTPLATAPVRSGHFLVRAAVPSALVGTAVTVHAHLLG